MKMKRDRKLSVNVNQEWVSRIQSLFSCIWASTHFLLAARAYKKYTAEKVKDSASATIFSTSACLG